MTQTVASESRAKTHEKMTAPALLVSEIRKLIACRIFQRSSILATPVRSAAGWQSTAWIAWPAGREIDQET